MVKICINCGKRIGLLEKCRWLDKKNKKPIHDKCIKEYKKKKLREILDSQEEKESEIRKILNRKLSISIITIIKIIILIIFCIFLATLYTFNIEHTLVLVAVSILISILLTFFSNSKIQKLENKLDDAYAKLKRIEWSDLYIEARDLRRKFEEVHNFYPDLIFTPCKRGATIVNLMYDVNENVLLYTGIRIKRHEKISQIANWKKEWEEIPTEKYFHYIPKSMIEFAKRNDNLKLLIVDDYAMTGDSLYYIKEHLKNDIFKPENIKTGTIVCHEIIKNTTRQPDEYGIDTTYKEFNFPWGKAI